jgi:hypothetical protein
MFRQPYIIPYRIREKVIRAAIKVAKSVRVDELNCSVSFCRKTSQLPVEDAIQIALKDEATLFNFIHRDAICGEPEHYDIGFSTMCGTPDYFLWIWVSMTDGDTLIKEFKLKQRVYATV